MCNNCGNINHNLSYESLKKKVNINGSNLHLLDFDTLDDLIDIWHESESVIELHEFLGLSMQEYSNLMKV